MCNVINESSFLTGLQRLVIWAGEASALPIEEVTLPQYLKSQGYDTHMVGKVSRSNNAFEKHMQYPKLFSLKITIYIFMLHFIRICITVKCYNYTKCCNLTNWYKFTRVIKRLCL